MPKYQSSPAQQEVSREEIQDNLIRYLNLKFKDHNSEHAYLSKQGEKEIKESEIAIRIASPHDGRLNEGFSKNAMGFLKELGIPAREYVDKEGKFTPHCIFVDLGQSVDVATTLQTSLDNYYEANKNEINSYLNGKKATFFADIKDRFDMLNRKYTTNNTKKAEILGGFIGELEQMAEALGPGMLDVAKKAKGSRRTTHGRVNA